MKKQKFIHTIELLYNAVDVQEVIYTTMQNFSNSDHHR